MDKSGFLNSVRPIFSVINQVGPVENQAEDPILYSQHSESDTNHTQQNSITESNIITAVTEITDESSDYTNSFTLTLQFPLLNNHLIN